MKNPVDEQRPAARAYSRLVGALLRMARSRGYNQLARTFPMTAVIAIEVLAFVGLPFASVTPLLVLALVVAVHRSRLGPAILSVAAGTAYGIGRLILAGYDPLDRPVIALAVSTAVLVPAVMLHVRSFNGRARRELVNRAVTRAVTQAEGREHLARNTTESERRLALDSLEALVWETRGNCESLRFLNSYSETLLGYPGGDDDSPEYSWEIVHRDDHRRVRSTLEAVREDGEQRQIEYRIMARDGFSVWLRDTIYRLPESEAGEHRLRGTAIDISARKTMEEELHREKERYQGLFEGVPVGLYRMSAHGEFLVANTALVNMMGYTNHQAFYATNANDIYADSMDRWRWQNSMVHVHGVRSFELPCRRADGTMFWVRNTARAVRAESGEIAYYEGVVEDISDSKRAKVAEEAAESQFRGLVEQSLVGIYMVQNDALVYANPKMTNIFGYSHRELLDLPNALSLVADEHRNKVAAYFAERLETDDNVPLSFRGVCRNGSVVEVEVHCTRTTFNDQPAVLGTLLDITARKETEERLFHAAFHDPLTGLPNRILFMERLEHSFQRQKRGKEFAVLFLDLNRFKAINDSLGHAAGDELLKLTAHRLQTCVRPGDSIARFGGDEFAILVEDVTQLTDATQIAERIRESISAPAEINGQEVLTGGSIGIAMSSAGYRKPEEILRDADMAMYRAKGAGTSHFEIFDQAMHGEALDRIALENDLQRASDRGDFHLHYLPIVCLKTGRMEGVEALVRWTHAERGAISPSTFLPLAEEVGSIIPIGRQVLRMACRQAVEWQERYPRERPFSVSVNLSARQIQGSAIVEDVRQVLEESGLPPGSLTLEITERAILDDQRAAAHMLNRLKGLGVRIFLDDFGTGYSSLGYLHSLPIDTLKIDRTFVNTIETQGSGSDLVRTIINVAHNLGMEVVAEGAETEEHIRLLQELGCEFAQGYHFAPPGSAEEIEALLDMGDFEMPDAAPARLRVLNQAS
jgi:diguanylate cyclase (GGDEF)-like protein/PAS domain S-box-containing protein